MTNRISNFDSAGRFRAFNYFSENKENVCKYLDKEQALVEFLEIQDKNQRLPFYKELHYQPIDNPLFPKSLRFHSLRLREETYYVQGYGLKSLISGVADTNTAEFGTKQYYNNFGTNGGQTLSFFGRPKSTIVDFILCEGDVKEGEMYVNFTEKPSFQERTRVHKNKADESVIIQLVIDSKSFNEILKSFRKELLEIMTFHITFLGMPEIYEPVNFDTKYNNHLKILGAREQVENEKDLPEKFKYSDYKFYKLKTNEFNDGHIVFSGKDQNMKGRFFYGIGFTDKFNKNLD